MPHRGILEFQSVNYLQLITSASMVINHMPSFSASASISLLSSVIEHSDETDNVILLSPLSSTSLSNELISYRHEFELPGFS